MTNQDNAQVELLRQGVEIIRYEDRILGICIRKNAKWDSTAFLTKHEALLQLGLLYYGKGKGSRPHAHKPVDRRINYTTEVLICVSGAMIYSFYDECEGWRKIFDCRIDAGDVLCLMGAGHGGVSPLKKGARLIEVKQGPFVGCQDKFFPSSEGERGRLV